MENPSIKTKVKHSASKNAWNVVGAQLGGKYKVARAPYIVIDSDDVTTQIQRSEALRHANFISFCFNHAEEILNHLH